MKATVTLPLACRREPARESLIQHAVSAGKCYRRFRRAVNRNIHTGSQLEIAVDVIVNVNSGTGDPNRSSDPRPISCVTADKSLFAEIKAFGARRAIDAKQPAVEPSW